MHSTQTVDVPSSIIGRMLLGRYRVVAELAKGGMGVVYLARMEGSAGFIKPVVIKLILPDYSDNPEFIGMFEREAQILAHLRDPGIVDVLEFRQDDEAYVMVLEYVRGYHLGQWQRYFRQQQQLLPIPIAMMLLIEVLESLHHAHTARHIDGSLMNIVHRDVSPSNIIVDAAGRARLLDFGVARMKGEQVYKTQVKGFRGKLSYSAPELFGGAEASPRSDIFACGVVLYELLTGRNPFRGANQTETFQSVMTKQPTPIHAVRDDGPDAIDQVLGQALVKDPEQRYRTAAEFAAALRQLLPTAEHQIRTDLQRIFCDEAHEALAAALNIESLSNRDKLWQAEPMQSETPALRQAPASGSTESASVALMQPAVSAAMRLMFVLVGALIAAVIGLLSYMLFSKPDPSAANVRIVELPTVHTPQLERTNTQTDSASPPETPTPTVDNTPAAEPTADQTATSASPVQKKAVRRAKRSDRPDAAALTRAFRRVEPGIERCFGDHALNLSGAPKIDIEFSINAQGKILQAKLSPAAVRGTSLGDCVLRVAQGTQFPAQGSPLTFKIPVTARRVR